MRVASASHAVFAATLIALGIMGLVKGDFAPIWNSVPTSFPAREGLAYLCSFISLACGVALLWRRTAAIAARVLLSYLLLWLLFVKGRFIVLAPNEEVSYQSSGETAVIVAGAWILYAWFANAWDNRYVGFATGEKGVRIARILYSLALIAFGLSHFFYVDQTAPLVPNWLPAHLFWAYFTGCTYLAAGIALLIGVCARLAATLSALQIGMLLLLVWMPLVTVGNLSEFQWSEAVVNWMLAAAAWVVADSYRSALWLAMTWPATSWLTGKRR